LFSGSRLGQLEIFPEVNIEVKVRYVFVLGAGFSRSKYKLRVWNETTGGLWGMLSLLYA